MSEYHKIQTVWHRDPETNNKTLIEGKWSLPEFEYLAGCQWELTEKVDGTNIRVIVKDGAVSFGGKTDNAQIPAKLVERLRQRFEGNAALLALGDCVLYGEGYGAGIQKGGGDYLESQDFTIFDVWCGGLWLRRTDVYDIAAKLGSLRVPDICYGTLHTAISMARTGFNSLLRKTEPEGLVMRPAEELQTRRGERIIAKIKLKDFAR